MIIDNKYILDEITNIKKEYEEDNRKRKKHLKIIEAIPEKIMKTIILPTYKILSLPRELRNNQYSANEGKIWALDFIEYVMKNKICIDTKKLYPEKDEMELKKFIKNKLRYALFYKLDKNKLFDKKDNTYIKKYQQFKSRIKKKEGFYNLKKEGKTYYLPTRIFEPAIFFHELGTTEIPKEILKKTENKTIIDAGAWIGDSALILNKQKPKKLILVEPVKENQQNLRKTILKNNLKNVEIITKGISEKNEELRIESKSFASTISEKGDTKIKLTTIDTISKTEEIGLIKMDIEGHELHAIKGSLKTIKRDKPILIICLYHRAQDFFEIPDLIKKTEPKYKFRFLNIGHDAGFGERILLGYVK